MTASLVTEQECAEIARDFAAEQKLCPTAQAQLQATLWSLAQRAANGGVVVDQPGKDLFGGGPKMGWVS